MSARSTFTADNFLNSNGFSGVYGGPSGNNPWNPINPATGAPMVLTVTQAQGSAAIGDSVTCYPDFSCWDSTNNVFVSIQNTNFPQGLY